MKVYAAIMAKIAKVLGAFYWVAITTIPHSYNEEPGWHSQLFLGAYQR